MQSYDFLRWAIRENLLEITRYERETGKKLDMVHGDKRYGDWRESLQHYSKMPGVYIHFSLFPKFGIYPSNKFTTPTGFYGYPLKPGKISEFAVERPYMIIFKPKSSTRLLNLDDSYTEGDLERDLQILMDNGLDTDVIEEAKKRARVQTPAGKIWNVSRIFSRIVSKGMLSDKRSSSKEAQDTEDKENFVNKWAQVIHRLLEYDGVADPGNGVIFGPEPAQSVFFDSNYLELLDVIKKDELTTNPDQLFDQSLKNHHNDVSLVDHTFGRIPKGSTFLTSMLVGVKFDRSIGGIDFFGTKFERPTFGNGITVQDCKFNETTLDQSSSSRVKFVNCLFQGATLGSSEFAGGGLIDCDLSKVKSSATRYTDSEIMNCKIDASMFSYGVFTNGNITNSSLKGTQFKNCKFASTTFRDLGLSKTKFDRTVLKGVTFENVDLRGVDFRSCIVHPDTKFVNCRKDDTTLFGDPANPGDIVASPDGFIHNWS